MKTSKGFSLFFKYKQRTVELKWTAADFNSAVQKSSHFEIFEGPGVPLAAFEDFDLNVFL